MQLPAGSEQTPGGEIADTRRAKREWAALDRRLEGLRHGHQVPSEAT